jgi:transcriptional regulator with XRE-family HTH domain
MGRKAVVTSPAAITAAEELGARLKIRRKNLGLSAQEVAQAAGISRITLHRIEAGESGVTLGSFLLVAAALGERIGLLGSPSKSPLPDQIHLKDFPQLNRLSWQLAESTILTPIEAWDIYTRNWRHLDEKDLLETEAQLIDSLRRSFELGPRV